MLDKNNKSEKQVLIERTISRARSGLFFLEDIMRHRTGGTDAAFSRSLYLLFAYNFELILSSLFILSSKKTVQKDITDDLILVSKKHNFATLFNQIPISFRFGISRVAKDESGGFTEYHIDLDNGSKITIQDLIDVRYDFKKDGTRKINNNEMEEMKNTISLLIEITDKIQKYFNEIQV